MNPTPLHNELKKVLVIDTETSGLDPLVHSVLSIGITPLIGDLEEEYFVFESEIISDARSMAIHGIDLNWLSTHGQSPLSVCERFEHALSLLETDSILLAGHNISFDISFMKRLYRVANRPWPQIISHRSIDTHTMLWQLASAHLIPFEACSSDGAFKFFDCSPPDSLRHSALGDAIATKQLFLKLLEWTASRT